MYLNFFALTREPFAMASVERELFTSVTHRETLSAIVYGLRAKKPLIAVVGEPGTGKTTVLHSVLAAMADYKYSVLDVTNPKLSAEALLRRIALYLDMSGAGTFTMADLDHVHARILTLHGEEDRLAIVIDEAQAMSHDALELLRLFSNYEASRRGIAQIVLVGQPQLWDNLRRPELTGLRDRIAIRAVLAPLSRAEATDYLEYRFRQAGSTAAEILTPDSVTLLLDHAGGIPRRINTIVDNALITAFGAGQKPVTRPLMQDALTALGFETPAPRRDMRLAFTVLGPPALFAVAMIFAAILPAPPANGHAAPPAITMAPAVPAVLGTLEPEAPAIQLANLATVPAAIAAPIVTETVPAAPPTQVFTAIPTLAPALADNLPTVQRPSGAAQRTATHQVQIGDTVNTLLQRYAGRADAKTLGQFRSLNPTLPRSNAIQPGQTVVVPLTAKVADGRLAD